MLVEEGSIPHALMLCGASGAKTVHGFIKKTEKTADSVDGIIKKRRKVRFGHGRKIENSENCISATAER